MTLTDKLVAVHDALAGASIAHAFGGALALAWCTERARGTIDLDLNVFVGPDAAGRVFDALPPGVAWSPAKVAAARHDGQVRLWWDEVPLDLFFNVSEFHEEVAQRVRFEPFAGRDVPFLACDDLVVFKAFFDRTRDWADLEDMAAAGTLDATAALGTLVRYLGPDDPRVERLGALADRLS